ncbi:hypothetical protein [Flavimaricola marinus]|uniref:Uncharacterized protein n=1 Tax=Flavimaricola marinus TaxID=1819565 RepID=A0A238LDH1_9RHOB|nr:hypothetical protein [Flavimaricola marinus]SMY07719.1 hypothetical protein LOM8899_01859 [Flavimaricola marinus]
MAAVLPSLAACVAGAIIGWALVRWANIAVARLWAIGLLLAVIVMFGIGIAKGEESGLALVVLATMFVLPGLIGSVFGMVLTEWRMRDQ